ncbi:hypothetical protein HJC23_012817 [Cyclotella cryptica]|uniref:Uncharacterized protein n=1 Tax=Cyclotella cryptica TaxID=29204 RepID=A0ABD3P0U5_9STRA
MLAKASGVLLLFFASCQAFLLPENTPGFVQFSHGSNLSQPIKSQLGAGLFGPKKANESQGDLSLGKRIIEIPAKSIKKGGLRFALGLHLIGLQNTPDSGSWRANQQSETVLEMHFKDNSAKFEVVLEDSCIAVDRYGQPSLAYLLQESVILHSVLDELGSLAFGGEVEKENRLLQLDESATTIEKARKVLPTRQA